MAICRSEVCVAWGITVIYHGKYFIGMLFKV